MNSDPTGDEDALGQFAASLSLVCKIAARAGLEIDTQNIAQVLAWRQVYEYAYATLCESGNLLIEVDAEMTKTDDPVMICRDAIDCAWDSMPKLEGWSRGVRAENLLLALNELHRIDRARTTGDGLTSNDIRGAIRAIAVFERERGRK
jgi:hypothetical protein